MDNFYEKYQIKITKILFSNWTVIQLCLKSLLEIPFHNMIIPN